MGLNSDTRAASNTLTALNALGALQLVRAVEPVARVDDNANLIGPELSANTRELAGKSDNDSILRRIFNQEVAVVALAGTVGTAVTGELGAAGRVTELDAGCAGEVVDGAGLGGSDITGGEGALVGWEVALRVGHVEGVVPDLLGVGVLVGVEVEVGVLGQHDGCRKDQ